MIEQRLLLACIGNAQAAALAIPGGKTKRHEAAFDHALAQKTIESAEHVRGTRLLRTETAKCADGHRAIKRGRASLPAYIAERDSEIVGTVTHEVV